MGDITGGQKLNNSSVLHWSSCLQIKRDEKKVTNIFQHFFFKKNSLSRPFRALQTGENLQKKFGSSISKKNYVHLFGLWNTQCNTMTHQK